MDAAENGNADFYRSQTGGAGADDADYDAFDVHLPFHIFPKRSGFILGSFGADYNSDTILRYRLGRPAAMVG